MPKLLFTTTSSMNLEPVVSGLKNFLPQGFEFQHQKYDKEKEAQFHYIGEVDDNIKRLVVSFDPDIIVYSGPAAGLCKPTIETFLRIKKRAKLVNLVCDGGCPTMHPLLEEYKKNHVFHCTINIDGNTHWPSSAVDVTSFGLIDPSYYRDIPKIKEIEFGFAGGLGSPNRQIDTHYLIKEHGLVIPERNEKYGTYDKYARFMCKTRKVVNFPEAGSGKVCHLKYRVIESGLGRCCLFEGANPVTRKYFISGHDYVEYESMEHLSKLLSEITKEEIEEKASNLYHKVINEFNPARVWQEVLFKIGF